MTVSSSLNRKAYTGDGSTTSFSTSPVVFYDTDELDVYVATTATGASTTLTENTHYTVSGGAGSTGSVSLAGGSSPYGAPSASQTLVIVRTLDLVQEFNPQNNDGSDADNIETAFDKLTMMVQQLNEGVGRSLKVPTSEGEQDAIVVAGKAGYYLRRNVAGTAFELAVGDANTSTFTQSGTGAVERSVTAKLGETVSVSDFGAVGDGSTDDTAAMQAAINTGRDVFVPGVSSYYRVSSALALQDNQRIYGEGERSEIRQVTALACVLSATSKTNVHVDKLHLYCVGDAGALTESGGVLFSSTNKSKVTDCVIENCRGWGVTINNGNDNTVSGNTFINAPSTGITDDTDIGGDIQVIRESCRNIVTANHCISGSGTGIKVQSVSDGDNADDNVIIGNVVRNAKIYGIIAYRNSGALPILQSVYRTVISGNTVDGVSGEVLNSITGTYTYGAGIYSQGAEDSCITGNTIANTHSGAVSFSSTLAPGAIGVGNQSRFVIDGNTIDTDGMNGMDLTDANVFGEAEQGAIVSNNIITNTTLRGIRARTMPGLSITGNAIDTTGSSGIEVNLSTTVLVEDYVIANNTVRNVTGIGITVLYVDGLTISGNNIRTPSVSGIVVQQSDNVAVTGNNINDHATRGIHITSTNDRVLVDGNLVYGDGTSTTGIFLEGLAKIGDNRVENNVANWDGAYAVLRGAPSTSAVGNVGGGEDDLKTYTIPANTLVSNNQGIHVVAWGTAANNSNPKTLRLKVGTATVLTTALTVSQAGSWRIEADIVRSGSNAQRVCAQLTQGGTTAFVDTEVSSITETETAAIIVKCTAEVTDGGGGINNDDIQQVGMIGRYMDN